MNEIAKKISLASLLSGSKANSELPGVRWLALRQWWEQLRADPARMERWLAGILLGGGCLGLLIGLLQFRYHLIQPYAWRSIPPTLSLSAAAQPVEPDPLGLRTKDTDHDGLSDYDELNVYNTSPYLPDSDSDGTNDRDEVKANTNPNCPTGQTCSLAEASPTTATTTLSLPIPGVLGVGLQSNQPVAAQIRVLLRQQGMSEDVLQGLSDEALIQAYQIASGNQSPTVATNSSVAATSTALTSLHGIQLPVDQIKQLSADQIRSLLRQQGVSQATIDQLSDQQLYQLVTETLQQ